MIQFLWGCVAGSLICIILGHTASTDATGKIDCDVRIRVEIVTCFIMMVIAIAASIYTIYTRYAL